MRAWRRRIPKWSPGWWVTGSGGGGGSLAVGPIASLPSAVAATGSRYKCTDSPYEFISISGAWVPFAFGYEMVQPVLANFTQANVDISTFDSTHGGIIWSAANSGSSNDVQYIGLPIPASGAYYVDSAVIATTILTQGSFGNGIFNGLTGSSDRLVWGGFGYANGTALWTYQGSEFTNKSTFAAAFVNSGAVLNAPLLWFRIYDDLTNLHWGISTNGYDYTQLFSGNRNGFLTPTDLGFVINSFNSAINVHMVHWSVHT
jgi:hypothetical protein